MALTAGEIAKVTNGTTSNLDYIVEKYVLDSRDGGQNTLFIAVAGENFDGHIFAENAYANGAISLLEKQPDKNIDYILVENTFQALNDIAKFKRRKTAAATFIGVTGSVGKTSTKNLFVSILKNIGTTSCSHRNYNNHYGLPISLSNMKEDTKYGVFELGMSGFNEIRHLSKILDPHIAVITPIAPAHTMFFSSIEDIVKAKTEIFEAESCKTAIINTDHKYYENIIAQARANEVKNIFTYGNDDDNAYIDSIIINEDYTQNIKATIYGEKIEFTLNLFGKNQAVNALSILCAAKFLGIKLNDIIPYFCTIKNDEGRGNIIQIQKTGRNYTIIDEAYNASPVAVRSALQNLQYFPYSMKKIIILADMKELGDQSIMYHTQLIQFIPQDTYMLITYGQHMKFLAEEVKSKNTRIKIIHCENIQDITIKLDEFAGDNNVVLVKGSNSTKISKVVDWLKT